GAEGPSLDQRKSWRTLSTGDRDSSSVRGAPERERASRRPESHAPSEKSLVYVAPALGLRRSAAARSGLAANPLTPAPLLPDPTSRSGTERREASCRPRRHDTSASAAGCAQSAGTCRWVRPHRAHRAVGTLRPRPDPEDRRGRKYVRRQSSEAARARI